MKTQYRLIAVDLSKQKELDAIQQIVFVGQIKNLDNYHALDADGSRQSVSVLTTFLF